VALSNRQLAEIPFSLSAKGDEVVLTAAVGDTLTGYRTQVKFSAATNGMSLGRYVNSQDQELFVALTARTFGSDNPTSVEISGWAPACPTPPPRWVRWSSARSCIIRGLGWPGQYPRRVH